MTHRRMMTTAATATASTGRDGTRTITGQIATYGQEFQRWGVRMKYEQGSIRLPETGPGSVKLCVQHDQDRPIGVCTGIEETPEGLRGTFVIPDMAHTAAYRDELEHLVRDGLSVGVFLDEESTDAVLAAEMALWDGQEQAEAITVSGELGETSIVTIPQFRTSRVDNSSEGAPVNRALVTTSNQPPAPPAPVPPAPAAAAAQAAARTNPVSAAREFASRILAIRNSDGPAASQRYVATALADITPAGNGAGNEDAGLAVQVIGELADDAYDAKYEPCVRGRELTGTQIIGWRWAVPPLVGDYAGNKAEIPTNAAKLEQVTAAPARLAGGHDLDRIYKDLGTAEVLVSYWRLMMQSYTEELDGKRLETVLDSAATGTAADTAAAISGGLGAVNNPDYILISQDLWDAEGSKPVSELPAVLSGGGLFGDPLPQVIPSAELTASTVVVGRRSARDFYTLNPPIRMEAVNIPLAGIDAGLYGYWGKVVVKADGVIAITVATPPAATAKGK